jgi:hypothetical protein
MKSATARDEEQMTTKTNACGHVEPLLLIKVANAK